MDNKDRVKNHFEAEAKQYDRIIQNLIPYYNQMVEALVNALPFPSATSIEAIDLGLRDWHCRSGHRGGLPQSSNHLP